MRVVQGPSTQIESLIARARAMQADGLALELGAPELAVAMAERAGLAVHGWHQASRDPAAAKAHPEWMHAPQHHEWLARFPDYSGGHPALVAPYIGLGTTAAAQHALARFRVAPKPAVVFLADIQGPPMGCGCGNPSCRSWDNAPGAKLAPSPYDDPELLFPLEFWRRAQEEHPGTRLIPVLCPECERGIDVDGLIDPDGPAGTNLCQGVACVSPCATVYWPKLLEAARAQGETVGLVLTVNALEKDHPVYGPPRAWAKRAHRHYGEDLLPVVETEDAGDFEHVLVVTDYPQTVWPVAPPPDYVPSVPPICCGG